MKSFFTVVYEIKNIFSALLSNTGRPYPLVSWRIVQCIPCVNQMSSLFHSVASHFMLSAGVQKNHATHMNSR